MSWIIRSKHDADVRRAEGVGAQPLGGDVSWAGRPGCRGLARAGLNRSMCPTWSRVSARIRRSSTSCSASTKVVARGFSTRVGMPRSRKAPATSRWALGRHGDGDGVDPVEEVAVIGVGSSSGKLRRSPSGLLGAAVDDADEFHLGHLGEDSGVMAAQVSDPDDADFQPIHDVFLHRSRARPCLPACWAST